MRVRVKVLNDERGFYLTDIFAYTCIGGTEEGLIASRSDARAVKVPDRFCLQPGGVMVTPGEVWGWSGAAERDGIAPVHVPGGAR